jgi:hypothetical protein
VAGAAVAFSIVGTKLYITNNDSFTVAGSTITYS